MLFNHPFLLAMAIVFSSFDEKDLSNENRLFDVANVEKLPLTICDCTAVVGLLTSEFLWNEICDYKQKHEDFFLLCEANVRTMLTGGDADKTFGLLNITGKVQKAIKRRYEDAISKSIILRLHASHEDNCLEKLLWTNYYNAQSLNKRMLPSQLNAYQLAADCVEYVLCTTRPKYPVKLELALIKNEVFAEEKKALFEKTLDNLKRNKGNIMLLTDGRVTFFQNTQKFKIGSCVKGESRWVDAQPLEKIKVCSVPLLLAWFLAKGIIVSNNIPQIIDDLKPFGWNVNALSPQTNRLDNVALRCCTAMCVNYHYQCACGNNCKVGGTCRYWTMEKVKNIITGWGQCIVDLTK